MISPPITAVLRVCCCEASPEAFFLLCPPTGDVTVVLDANTTDAVSQESGQNLTGKHQTVGGKNLGHVKGKKKI